LGNPCKHLRIVTDLLGMFLDIIDRKVLLQFDQYRLTSTVSNRVAGSRASSSLAASKSAAEYFQTKRRWLEV